MSTLILETQEPPSFVLETAQTVAIEFAENDEDFAQIRYLRGEKGEQGDAGASGPAGVPGVPQGVVKVAVQSLGGHRAVIGVGESGCDYADANTENHAGRVLGVTNGAAASGGNVTVTTEGEMAESSWTWTPNESIWLGLNGLLTQVLPEVQGVAFAQRVGFAMSATKMYVEIGESVIF